MSTSIAQVLPGRAEISRLTPWRARLVVALAMAASGVAGFAFAGHPAAADPALTRLLRAMAAIKLLIAAGAGAALYWRLASPVGPWRLAGYALSGAAMAAGPGLIWNMAHIAAGAALLHGGLAATVLLLWRDPETAASLERAIWLKTFKRGAPDTARHGPKHGPKPIAPSGQPKSPQKPRKPKFFWLLFFQKK